jgi:DUF1680 family protein
VSIAIALWAIQADRWVYRQLNDIGAGKIPAPHEVIVDRKSRFPREGPVDKHGSHIYPKNVVLATRLPERSVPEALIRVRRKAQVFQHPNKRYRRIYRDNNIVPVN